jgi:hypothetical protein
MAYRINGKNLAVARLMPRGINGEPRLKYLHANSKGVTSISPHVIARVSLPSTSSPVQPTIWPKETVDEFLKSASGDLNEAMVVDDGIEAVTSPEYIVPVIDKEIPEPGEETATFTVNAELLIKVLKAACDVTTDADKTVRLRVVPSRNRMRIDAYCQPGEQEFVAVINGMEYTGANIPGDAPSDAAPKAEMKPIQGNLGLKSNTGRRFRA